LKHKRSVDDLTTAELRQLLIERRRTDRQTRLEHYRKSGRVVRVEPAPRPIAVDALRSEPLLDVEEQRQEEKRYVRRRWFDRLLLLVEVVAVIGLVLLVFNGVSLLRNLNQEAASALVQPTLTPTAVIMAVVLPVPTPGPKQAMRIQITAISVDAPVVQGDGWEQLKKGVAQHNGTPDPGEKGNIVLSAHNDVFGEIFRDLDKLNPGDEIVLFTAQRTYTYVVEQTQVVEPTHVEVLEPTTEPIVTLISCYPYLIDNQRIVVVASLKE
jgi:sortase A